MKVYLLMGLDYNAEYEDEDFIIGVFSTYEKAQQEQFRIAKNPYVGAIRIGQIWIEEFILDKINY
jgi:hypothetical protein